MNSSDESIVKHPQRKVIRAILVKVPAKQPPDRIVAVLALIRNGIGDLLLIHTLHQFFDFFGAHRCPDKRTHQEWQAQQ